ncbi:MAG: FAD-dependent oxidoreductase, partial [Nanoarchaeota archaeon]|nr:FAD-dependent oxidoreductase [Nanoarchaeota archaeon]
MKSFDLIVIGSGAGLNVAGGAAEQGLKVAIVEDGPLGGTCLNRGCIPSKIVIHSAETAETIKNASQFGLTAKLTTVNFNAVTNRASKTVDSDAHSIEKNIRAEKNPALFKGRGRFVDKNVIEVNGEHITGKKIVIATGARPFIPPIHGLDRVPYLTSTEALRQTKRPQSMIILGGGYIGVELGFFYAALGTKVTIVQRNNVLIPREDKDIALTITNLWKKKYHLLLNTDAIKVEPNGKKIAVTVKTGNKTTKISAEKLLVATGVKPNTDTLALEKSGIETTKQGFIKVNKYMETNVENIWALGDIAG